MMAFGFAGAGKNLGGAWDGGGGEGEDMVGALRVARNTVR